MIMESQRSATDLRADRANMITTIRRRHKKRIKNVWHNDVNAKETITWMIISFHV